MQPSQVTKWIADARFGPYLAEAEGNHGSALALYVWNTRISAASLETLHHVEVLLRNAVDAQFQPVDASENPRDTWLEDSAVLNEASRQRVRDTIRRLTRAHRTPTRGRVVAGLSFGFWRALFDKKYDGLWVSNLHRAFPASSGDRAEIATLMANLVPFRNRLAHHETIVRRQIGSHYEEMLTLASLIDPLARSWIDHVSHVRELLDARPEPLEILQGEVVGEIESFRASDRLSRNALHDRTAR